MIKYTVQITNEALKDMEAIYDYIANEFFSPSTALNQYNRIAEEIMELSYMPQRFNLLEFEPEHSRGIRRRNIDNYAIFYIIKDDIVIVINVLYGASDIEKKLK